LVQDLCELASSDELKIASDGFFIALQELGERPFIDDKNEEGIDAQVRRDSDIVDRVQCGVAQGPNAIILMQGPRVS
jgi:hypothetical protein